MCLFVFLQPIRLHRPITALGDADSKRALPNTRFTFELATKVDGRSAKCPSFATNEGRFMRSRPSIQPSSQVQK